MGGEVSRPEYTPPSQRSFYLVMGTPEISYTRANGQGGPLIFNVHVPKREGPELVEESTSLKNLVNIATKHPMKLVAVDGKDLEKGFRLGVLLDASVAPTDLKLYAGVELEARAGDGMHIMPISEDQEQFLIAEKRFDDLDSAALGHLDKPQTETEGDDEPVVSVAPAQGGMQSSLLQPLEAIKHAPILLQHLKPSAPPSELSTPNSLKVCPLLMRIEYQAEVLVEEDVGDEDLPNASAAIQTPREKEDADGTNDDDDDAAVEQRRGSVSPSLKTKRVIVAGYEKRILYTAFSFSQNEYDRLKTESAAAAAGSSDPATSLPDPPTLRLSVVKQFLECHIGGGSLDGKGNNNDGCGSDEIEVYELDDIFDLAGESSPMPARTTSTANAGGDADGDADGGEGGTSSPASTLKPQPSELVEEDEDEDNVCVVCLTNPKDTVIIPCRHMCLCGECAALLKQQSNKCPICRQTIEKLMTRKM